MLLASDAPPDLNECGACAPGCRVAIRCYVPVKILPYLVIAKVFPHVHCALFPMCASPARDKLHFVVVISNSLLYLYILYILLFKQTIGVTPTGNPRIRARRCVARCPPSLVSVCCKICSFLTETCSLFIYSVPLDLWGPPFFCGLPCCLSRLIRTPPSFALYL